MGCGPFSGRKVSRSVFDAPTPQKPKAPNPDPDNYLIRGSEQIGTFTIVSINYPDCSNYEGNKILVFSGTNINRIREQKKIDPHFSKSKLFLSPIARFEPTARGLNMARIFAESMWNSR